jgi:hypothetical protein
MAEEDEACQALKDALLRVARIPRPSIRNRILWETLKWCAAILGFSVEQGE